MNSCQAKATACSGVAAGAPPLEGGPGLKGGFNSFGTEELIVIGLLDCPAACHGERASTTLAREIMLTPVHRRRVTCILAPRSVQPKRKQIVKRYRCQSWIVNSCDRVLWCSACRDRGPIGSRVFGCGSFPFPGSSRFAWRGVFRSGLIGAGRQDELVFLHAQGNHSLLLPLLPAL